MSVPISTSVINCLRQFSRLVFSNTLVSFEDQVPLSLWKDELDRLRSWAANIGAHQRNHSSLDYRLRNASHIRDQVLRLLSRLEREFEEIQDISIASHNNDVVSDSDSEEESQTYLQGIYSSLHEVVNCLFQLSVAIRQPAQHDRLARIKRGDVQMWEPTDRRHVIDKYPAIHAELADRLGRAISHRRAILRYNERHRQKLSHGLDEIVDGDLASSQASSIPSSTNATEYYDNPIVNIDSDSTSIDTGTSYADSTFQSETKITVPPLPRESKGGTPYECPYCFYMISIFNHHSWARHVFRDIMAYSCIFLDCPTPYQLYATRGEWYDHLESQHLQELNDQTGSDCLFCGTCITSPKTPKRHITRHLQELALFALPPLHADDEGSSTSLDSDSSDESQPPASTSGMISSDRVTTLPDESTAGPENKYQIPIVISSPVKGAEGKALMLMDSQSTKNLMSRRLSQSLQLELDTTGTVTEEMIRTLAAEPLPLTGIARGVEWHPVGRTKTYKSDFLILDMREFDVIVGQEDINKYGLVRLFPAGNLFGDASASGGIRKGIRGISGAFRKTFNREKPSSQ